MTTTTYLIVLSALVAAHVTAFPFGAPRSACGSMAPIHMLFGAQEGLPPFNLAVSSGQANAASGVRVTLQSTGDAEFKGYIIQARSGTDNTALGTWSVEGSQGKTMDCPGGVANAVTHSSSRTRSRSETFLWTPPADFQGQVIFRATVVIGFRTYFTDISSAVVTVV